MAESIHDLYLRLDLHYDDLQSGFVEAENTLRTNMTRLRRENTTIRLRTEADLSGLDAVNDATEIFTIRQNALNQLIANQMDRVQMASAEYTNMARAHGANSDQARRATQIFERERVALGRLQRELRELNDSMNESARENNSFLGNLQERINNISASAGRLAGVTAAFVAVGAAVSTVSDKSVELIEKFRELQKQSYDLNMPFAESKDFLRQMRLGGGDYGDFEGYIRGITDAFVKGEYDDPEAIALNKFGAKITDETGRLKNFKDLTEEVYQAWKKADAAGEGIEFLQLTGGEAGIRDAIQYFKRYEEAKEDASKVFDSGIDPEELHRAERALNLLTEQSGEFKDALVNMITPAATVAMEELFELFHSGTEIVVESTQAIKRWGFIFDEAISTAEKFFNGSEINSDFSGIFDRADKKFKYQQLLQSVLKKKQELQDEELKKKGNPLNQYADKRLHKLQDDLQDLRIEMDFDGDDYQKALKQAEVWRDRSLRDQWFLSDDEKNAIQDLYSAKREQIEQQHQAELEKSAKRAQEMLKNAADIEFAQTHSAFEKQLRDIEEWKEAQLEKADTAEEVAATIANAAMKEADAFEKEMDRIKGKIESAQDRLARLTLSQYENDVRNAQKQYLEDIKDLPKPLADALYKAQMGQIKQRAREDKGGDYTKRPKGGQDFGGSQFLDFTKRANQSAISLINMDSTLLAQQKLLGENSIQWQDVNARIEKAGQQTTAFNDSVKKAASSSLNFSDAISEIGKSSIDENLQKTQKQIDALGNQAVQTADKFRNAGSNLDTIQQGLNTALEWQNQKSAEEKNIKFPDEEKDSGTIYGDDPFYSHNYEQNGIKVIYGDDESGMTENFPDSPNQADSDIDSFLSQFDSSIKQIESATKPLTETFQQVDNSAKPLQENLKTTADATAPLTEKLNELSYSIETISTAIKNTAEKISQIEFHSETPTVPQYDFSKNLFGGTFDFNPFNTPRNYENSGMNVGLISAIQQLTDSQSQRTIEIVTEIQNLTQNLSQPLTELTQTAGQIAQSLSEKVSNQKQPPNITIQLTPNINLAGAYVFDNAMRTQLANDITTEVANAVKSAVETSTTQMNYGYGN